LIILFLTPTFAKAEVGLILKDTFYTFDTDEASCRMQIQRKKVRERKLREYYYALGMDPLDEKLKASAIFVSMFTDYDLMSTPKVLVTHTWEVNDSFIEIYINDPENLFLELDTNGLWWRERLTRFPDRIDFSLIKETKELTTNHQIFYSDFCTGKINTTLEWGTKYNPEKPTVNELLLLL
jgi:hypothetical protein